MIKTPVSTYFDKDVYPYPQIDDADSNFISECNKEDTAKEIVKRINMHDEFVAVVNELIPSFIRDSWIDDEDGKSSWTDEDGKRIMYFYELLERCK